MTNGINLIQIIIAIAIYGGSLFGVGFFCYQAGWNSAPKEINQYITQDNKTFVDTRTITETRVLAGTIDVDVINSNRTEKVNLVIKDFTNISITSSTNSNTMGITNFIRQEFH